MPVNPRCSFCPDHALIMLELWYEYSYGNALHSKKVYFCEDHEIVHDTIVAIPGLWEDMKEADDKPR